MFSNGKSGETEKEVLLPASKNAYITGFSLSGGQPSNNVRPRVCDEADSSSNPNPMISMIPPPPAPVGSNFLCQKPRLDYGFQNYDLSTYRRYTTRFLTYKSWPKSHPIKADQLTRAGFLYTGEGDKVTCPWCRIQLTEWETYDVPIEEHRRHSPYCDFIKMLFP